MNKERKKRIRDKIKKMRKDELTTLAKSLDLNRYSQLRVEELRRKIITESDLVQLEKKLGVNNKLKEILNHPAFLIFGIIGVIATLYFGITGLSKSNLDRQNELMFKMSSLYDEITDEYIYGSKIFGVREDGKIILGKHSKESEMKITSDWNKLRLNIEKDKGLITLSMAQPKWRMKDTINNNEININIGQLTQEISIKPMGEETLIGNVFIGGKANMYFEQIDEIENLPIYLIRFK